ncbi:rRNA pseudouridine synthase [Candidatus Saccharibacteria bacterium]|nr:rRNA pseudouridine synthase [Candidatus Saccharibacteria bacterium]
MHPLDKPNKAERLNKYLAFNLGLSRRQADNLIKQGRVKINNQSAEIGSRVYQTDEITVNDKLVRPKPNYTYIALHKPRGYVCSRKKQGSTPTIYDLLPKEYHDLKPVGRLDADSSGLLLLTDDGDFTFTMTHPKFYKQKTYLVTLDKDLQPLHHQMINDFGIKLNDGPSKLQLERQQDNDSKRWVVAMSEGRNRQIRRTFSALGYKVTKLHRITFGDYKLTDTERGKLRHVKKLS